MRGRRWVVAGAALAVAAVAVVVTRDEPRAAPVRAGSPHATDLVDAPGWRWLVYRGLEVEVPEAWTHGKFWCAFPTSNAVMKNDVPDDGDCMVYPPASLNVVVVGRPNPDAGSGSSVEVSGLAARRVRYLNWRTNQTGDAVQVPAADAEVFVSGPDTAAAERVLGSIRVRQGTDVRGCTIHETDLYATVPPARAEAKDVMVPGTPVQASVCRYDRTGWAARSVLLDRDGAASLAGVLNGLAPGFSAPIAHSLDRVGPERLVVTFRYDDGPDVVVYVHGSGERDLGASNGAVTGQLSKALEDAVRPIAGWRYTYEADRLL